MKKIIIYSLLLIACVFGACQQDRVSSDPSLQLSFSQDTVLFDTVFTAMGTSTHRVMVYNPHKNAINIEQVSMQDGKYFHIGRGQLSCRDFGYV